MFPWMWIWQVQQASAQFEVWNGNQAVFACALKMPYSHSTKQRMVWECGDQHYAELVCMPQIRSSVMVGFNTQDWIKQLKECRQCWTWVGFVCFSFLSIIFTMALLHNSCDQKLVIKANASLAIRASDWLIYDLHLIFRLNFITIFSVAGSRSHTRISLIRDYCIHLFQMCT